MGDHKGMTMAKVDEFRPPGWDRPPQPLRAAKASPARKSYLRQLSLRHIMIALIYFAMLFWAIKQVVETNGVLQMVLLGVVVGLGFCAFGLWVALKSPRLSILGWTFFVIGYMVIMAVTTSFFAIPSLPILIGSIIYLTHRRRSNDQDSLLWVLSVAAERGMPLAPGVQALSGQVSGIFEIWTASLAEMLRGGVPLPDALDSVPRLVPTSSSLLIRTGWESGNLAAGLRQAVEARSRRLSVARSAGGRLAYLLWIITVGQGIVGFVMYFIVPKFEAIFRDFGIELPEVTLLVIRASHFLVDYVWLYTLAELALIVYLLMVLFGWGNLNVPVFDRLFVRRHTILILRSLAVVVEAGRPIAPALYSLSQWYPTGWVHARLRQAALDASQGVEWTEALFENGLISWSDIGVLTSAQRAGNLAWALRELAETGERRLGYRLQVWTQILFVLAMLVLAGMVFVIAVAYFAPLTTLIMRLAR